MFQLKFSLLGSPQATIDGMPVTVESRKALALLYYLATSGERYSRDHLATLFWPEQSQKRARSGLRQALWMLRKAGLEPWLAVDQDAMALEPGYWCDVHQFREQIEAGQLGEALALYRDEFLLGFTLRDCPEFDQWQFLQADELRRLLAGALETLMQQCAEQGDYEAALAHARRWLSLDPLFESVHRHLMRLYALAGQQAVALRQYEECVRILDEELGIPPEEETTALYEAIKTRQFPPASATSVPTPSRASSPDPMPAPVATPQPSVVFHNLPAQLTPFVGRDTEVVELEKLLVDEGVRLITITGFGGMGKTRLALHVATQFVETAAARSLFPQGVLFVPLHALDSTSGIVSAIAEAAAFTFHSSLPPRQQLLDYLRNRKMLLVLDNFEHLLDSTDLISEILTTAPAVKLLVTSREPLRIQGEWQWAVAGLPFPQEPVDGETLLTYDAVRLFVQNAQRTQPEFSFDAAQPEVVRICRLLEGMPLGIELAAAWLKMMSCAQIATEIERNLAFLTTRLRNVPDRHRSIQVVFEQSWHLLSPDEREVFQRLSVFRGGFDRDAAETIANASWSDLVALVEKSLLRVDPGGRYQIHELLRQFADAKLAADPKCKEETLERYSDYYLRFLQAREEALLGPQQQVALSEIGEEIENIRMGWNWAVTRGKAEIIERSVDGLYHFYQIRSRYHEGAESFARVLDHLSPSDGAGARMRANVLARLGSFSQSLGDYEVAECYLRAGLDAAQELGDQREVAFGLNLLGQVAAWRGQKEEARDYLSRSLVISRAIDDKFGVVSALQQSANLLYATFGDYAASKELAEESLFFSREIGRADWLAYALDTLGFVTFALGEYQSSLTYYQEGLAYFEEIGDQHGMALTLGGIGMVHWALGPAHLDEARAAFERSLSLCREIGHRGQVSGRLGGLARVLNDLGDYEQARQCGEEGLAIARALDSPVYLAHNLYCLTETACGMNDLKTARRYLREGLQVAFEIQLLSNLTIYLYYYALILAKESQLPSLDREVRRQKRQTASSVLALVQAHPATWHIFKERAAWLQDWIASDRSAETVTDAAVERADPDRLNEMVSAVLQELASGASESALLPTPK